jgi:hypothetical protein
MAQGTLRKQLGTKGGTKMLPRFVAQVATFCVAVGRRDGVPGTPTGTPRGANVGQNGGERAGGSDEADRLAFLSHKMAPSSANTP